MDIFTLSAAIAIKSDTDLCTATILSAAPSFQVFAGPGDVWHDGRLYLRVTAVKVVYKDNRIEDSGLLAWNGSDVVAFCEWMAPEQSVEVVTGNGWYKTNKGNFIEFLWIDGRLIEYKKLTAAEYYAAANIG